MDITAHVMVCNEETWIGHILEPLLQAFDNVLIFDCGSTDETVSRIYDVLTLNSNKKAHVLFETVGRLSPEENGRIRQEMTDETHTHWAMIVDGDELYSVDDLQKLNEYEPPSEGILGYTGLQPICWIDGKFWLTERHQRHSLFDVRQVRWSNAYPFEIPTYYDQPVHHFSVPDVVGIDLHHLYRSSKDEETFHRHDAIRLPGEPIHPCVLTVDLGRWPNPYRQEARI